MNGNCFEIGTIQAFLDGELAPEKSLRLTDHVAACDACARLMAEAEEENSVVFSALERELDTLVPTQRLWSRINESIEVEKGHASVWQKLLVYVRLSIANPSIVAAAGIVLVAGMFVLLWMPGEGPQVALDAPDARPAQLAPDTTTPGDGGTSGTVTASTGTANQNPPAALTVSESRHSPEKLRKMITTADLRRPADPVRDAQYLNANAYLPGEESYVRTIADLKQNVDGQKDTVMTPSTRVSFERDMAVVNDSIQKMREVVKRNPRNQAARQVLYASYQDKIDLLNSVAQREELIASLR